MDEAVERVALHMRRNRFARTRRGDSFDEDLPLTDNELDDARAALLAAIPIIAEEMARVADMHDHRGDVGKAIRSHAQHLVGKVGEGA